jgi:hypothetical protein
MNELVDRTKVAGGAQRKKLVSEPEAQLHTTRGLYSRSSFATDSGRQEITYGRPTVTSRAEAPPLVAWNTHRHEAVGVLERTWLL